MIRTSVAPIAALLGCLAMLPAADPHAGHDHAGHEHGPVAVIGSLTVGAYAVAASASGQATAGGAWHVELRLSPAAPAPRAVRLWVGSESARGSAKAKAAPERDAPGEFSAHVEVPHPLPAGSRLWVAIESQEGVVAAGSTALPQTPASPGHGPDDGHGH